MLLDGKLEEEAQKVGSVVDPVSEISLLHVVLLSKSALMSYILCSTYTSPTSIGACHLVHLPAAVLQCALTCRIPPTPSTSFCRES